MLLRPGTCYESEGRQCMAIFENFFEVPQLEENFLSLFCDSTKMCTYFYLVFFAAVLLGMTCLKLAIPGILIFFRRSSHCKFYVFGAEDE